MKCQICKKDMHKIGPFAHRIKEGHPIPKWDGVIKYQCINQECVNYEKFIEVIAGDEPTNS